MTTTGTCQPPPTRVTKRSAARQLGVDYRAIDRMIAQGTLKVVPIPGAVRAIVLQSSIDEVLTAMRAAS